MGNLLKELEMAQDNKGAKEVLNARKNELSVVAQDQNWRSYVANQLKCADMWQADWGFLGGQSASGENKSMTKEEKIAALEAECKKLTTKTMTTSSGSYGTVPKAVKDLEMFSMKHNNIQKDPDLMP